MAAVAALPGSAWSDDISGEWEVEMTGQDPSITRAWYEFKAEGSKLTGSAMGFMEDERPILDGRITGDRVFFTLKDYVRNRVIEYRYQGKVSGDTIRFKVYRLGGGNRSWSFTVKKARR
jgi:hypothetical protein